MAMLNNQRVYYTLVQWCSVNPAGFYDIPLRLAMAWSGHRLIRKGRRIHEIPSGNLT